jgi:hypothetical protein
MTLPRPVLKTNVPLFFAAVLTLTPVAALAQAACDHEKAQSCAVGYVWDAETKACIQVST